MSEQDDINDEEYERDEDDVRDVRLCHHCKSPTVGEGCGFCGNDLCPACFEMGAGFCHDPHTYEQICAYEDAVYPPENEKAAEERQRQRKAHKELVAAGIIPPP